MRTYFSTPLVAWLLSATGAAGQGMVSVALAVLLDGRQTEAVETCPVRTACTFKSGPLTIDVLPGRNGGAVVLSATGIEPVFLDEKSSIYVLSGGIETYPIFDMAADGYVSNARNTAVGYMQVFLRHSPD